MFKKIDSVCKTNANSLAFKSLLLLLFMSLFLSACGGQSGSDGDGGTGGTDITDSTGDLRYAPYDVEIVQPRGDLDTSNRFYKAYPGLEYNVKIAVRGGDFSALRYTLDSAPGGMSIDARTGVVQWVPATTGTDYSVTVRVTDGITTDSVTWPITVTTDGFVFIDASASAGGDGSINNPLQGFLDIYGPTESDDSYRDHFAYFREGTYLVESNATTANGGAQWGTQKPVVMLSYPNETVTFDWSQAYLFYDAVGDNTYVDGINHTGAGAHVSASGGEGVWTFRLFGDDVTFRRNHFDGIASVSGSHNQSYIMTISRSSVGNKRWAITENTFDGEFANAYAIACMYDIRSGVIEANVATQVGNLGVGVKTRNQALAIRGNWLQGQGKLYWIYNEFGEGGNHEVSWNFGESTTYTYAVNEGYADTQLPAHAIRNTFVGNTFYRYITEDSTEYFEVDNVIVSDQTNGFVSEAVSDSSKIVQSGNLISATTDNFLDTATGMLIGDFASENDNKGHNALAASP